MESVVSGSVVGAQFMLGMLKFTGMSKSLQLPFLPN